MASFMQSFGEEACGLFARAQKLSDALEPLMGFNCCENAGFLVWASLFHLRFRRWGFGE